MAHGNHDHISSQHAHNRLTGKYVSQRSRTRKNKIRLIERELLTAGMAHLPLLQSRLSFWQKNI